MKSLWSGTGDSAMKRSGTESVGSRYFRASPSYGGVRRRSAGDLNEARKLGAAPSPPMANLPLPKPPRSSPSPLDLGWTSAGPQPTLKQCRSEPVSPQSQGPDGDRCAGSLDELNFQLEEALGREHQELQSMLANWNRRVERRKQEHVRRQRELLRRFLEEHVPTAEEAHGNCLPGQLPDESAAAREVSAEAPMEHMFSTIDAAKDYQADLAEKTDAARALESALTRDLSTAFGSEMTLAKDVEIPIPEVRFEAGIKEEDKVPSSTTAASGPVPDSPAVGGGGSVAPAGAADVADCPEDRQSSSSSDTPRWMKRSKTSSGFRAEPSQSRRLYPTSWRQYVSPEKAKTKNKRSNFQIVTRVTDDMTPLQAFTKSRYYEWLSGLLITLNAFFIGYQTDWIAMKASELAQEGLVPVVEEPVSFIVIQGIFSLLFALELTPRWVADGFITFFQTADKMWNFFDVFVVVISFIDFFISVIEQATVTGNSSVMGNVSVLRVARVIRIIRVARVIRVMRFFRELRMMIYSILGSMKALFWSVVVLVLMFFIFGISLTLGTIYHLDTLDMWTSLDTADLRKSFSTLPRSILSLYMAMSGGRNWGDFFNILSDVSGLYAHLFLTFVTTAIFAVGNVVTGIFVENALQSNQTDKEVLVQDEMEARKEYFLHMQEVFEELDDDTDGVITMDEFERKLDDERVIAYFNVLNLDVSDARMLFTLLDYDQSGEVAIEEFLAGCNRLKGESRSLDLAIMQLEVRWLKEAFMGFADFTSEALSKPGMPNGGEDRSRSVNSQAAAVSALAAARRASNRSDRRSQTAP